MFNKHPMLIKSYSFKQARKKVTCALFLLGLCLFATPTLTAQQPDDDDDTNFGPVFVRRFSGGGKFRYLPLETMAKGTLSTSVIDTVDVDARSSGDSSRYGYGLTTQVAVTKKWAFALELLSSKIEYNTVREVTTYIVDPFENVLLETQLVSSDETTSARLWDIPVLFRYYNKSRFNRGPRVFFEGGAVVRRATDISTSIETTTSTTNPNVEGMTDCCDKSPARVANPNALGGAVGIGLQLIDDVGIRVVPGFRYTRWFSNAFRRPAHPVREASTRGDHCFDLLTERARPHLCTSAACIYNDDPARKHPREPARCRSGSPAPQRKCSNVVLHGPFNQQGTDGRTTRTTGFRAG